MDSLHWIYLCFSVRLKSSQVGKSPKKKKSPRNLQFQSEFNPGSKVDMEDPGKSHLAMAKVYSDKKYHIILLRRSALITPLTVCILQILIDYHPLHYVYTLLQKKHTFNLWIFLTTLGQGWWPWVMSNVSNPPGLIFLDGVFWIFLPGALFTSEITQGHWPWPRVIRENWWIKCMFLLKKSYVQPPLSFGCPRKQLSPVWLSVLLPGLDDLDEEPDINIKRDELVNPYWMDSPDLGKGRIKMLDQAETYFFKVISKRSSLPSKNFLCISMDMLQIGPLVLVGRLVEAFNESCDGLHTYIAYIFINATLN